MPKIGFGVSEATNIFNTPWIWDPNVLELETSPITSIYDMESKDPNQWQPAYAISEEQGTNTFGLVFLYHFPVFPLLMMPGVPYQAHNRDEMQEG